MELRHLKYFVVLAEELNFTKAAARLRISQPPLTAQIHTLEEELELQLFNRTKHKVELTRAGYVLSWKGSGARFKSLVSSRSALSQSLQGSAGPQIDHKSWWSLDLYVRRSAARSRL